MSKNKKIIVWISLVIFILSVFFFFLRDGDQSPRQMIFVSVDGVKVSHFQELLSQNKLPNFKRMIEDGGENSLAVITGHTLTETAPGNSELHTGLGASVTNITDNNCGRVIPPGLTIFERLANFNPKIILGSIYGKQTCYVPLAIFSDAKRVISWWQDMGTYRYEKYVTANCANSLDVSSKALEFLRAHKTDPFYLFIYFGAPDCAGHTFGLPSFEYDQALVNIDSGLGILLDEIGFLNIKPQIIVSGDHGWNTGTSGHNIVNEETLTVALITNNSNLIDNISTQNKRKQCDIAPTILSYFGMTSDQYPDITRFGCGSLMDSL